MSTQHTHGMRNNNGLLNTAALFIILFSLVLLIYLASDILFPLLMALLMAIMLRPVVAFLNTRLKFPNVIAVLLSVIMSLAVIAAIVFFISRQITSFMGDLPQIRHNLSNHLHQVEDWLNEHLNISYNKQKDYIAQIKEGNMPGNFTAGSVLNSFSGNLFSAVMIFMYTFLILLYRTLFFNFLTRLISPVHHAVLREILFEIKVVIRGYLAGLLIELCIVAVMVSAGQWLVGIDYFIFLGMLTAILNLIPYIGILLATIISIFVALASSTSLSPVLGVLVVNAVVHFVDSNILLPRIVGSKVSINALASIVGVIIGGTLVGVAGMFLAIPVIAILKVIFDRIEPLKPWGYLLGQEVPKTFSWAYTGPDMEETAHEQVAEEKQQGNEGQQSTDPGQSKDQ